MNFIHMFARFVFVAALLGLVGCAARAPASVADIKTTIALTTEVNKPIDTKVAYHFPVELYRERIQVYDAYSGGGSVHAGAAMRKASDLVMKDYFSEAEFLSNDSSFNYLFAFDAKTEAKGVTSTRFDYSSDVTMKVFNYLGEKLFSATSTVLLKSGVAGDQQALINVYSSAIKENLIKFFNSVTDINSVFTNKENFATVEDVDIKNLLSLEKPISTGSGFVINKDGMIVTSSHILKDCLLVEVGQESVLTRAQEIEKSVLLDIAVLSGKPRDNYAYFYKAKPADLGESVFTIGFPLSDILAASPNLTLGNVSSLRAMKGSKGFLQFTAPIQPGNSGGPLLRNNGEILGMVTSTLRAQGGTQNLNFATSAEMMKRYLYDKGIRFHTATKNNTLEQSISESKNFATQVACYR